MSLDKEDIEKIHEATLKVLSNTGIYFWNSPEAIEILKKAGCRVKDTRVFYPSELVEETLKLVPDRNNLRMYSPDGKMSIGLKKGEVNFSTIGNPYYIFDFDKGKSRNAVESDVDKFRIIFNNLDNFQIECGYLVLESMRKKGEASLLKCENVEEVLAYLRGRLFRQETVKKICFPSLGRSKEQVRLGILQCLIFRRSLKDLIERPMDVVWVNPVSPLQYDDQTEGLVEGAKQGMPVMLSSDVLMGGTGPITLAGTLVQQNAEILAGIVLAQLANPSTTVIYGSVSNPIDLRVADISMGSIEQAMITVATIQMADFYGLPCRVAPGNSGARKPGARATTEAVLGIYMGATAGANIITTGLLDSTVMLSYEHLIVMDEMIAQIKRAIRGINTEEERLALDLIHKEGHPNPNYLGTEHTLKFMREEIYSSEFSGRIEASYEDWYKKANKKVKEILENNPPLEWDKETKEKIKAVEARIKEDNQTWRKEKEGWWKYYIQDF